MHTTAHIATRLPARVVGARLQGLLVYDGEGRVLYERELPHDVARDCIALAVEQGEL